MSKSIKRELEHAQHMLHEVTNNYSMSVSDHKKIYWGSQVSKWSKEVNKLTKLLGTSPTPSKAKAHDILLAGSKHMQDRAKTYDMPDGERSMAKTVTLFNIFYGTNLTEDQGWRFMVFLKMVRSIQGKFKLDNFEDAVAYEALAAEFLESQQGQVDGTD